jgi:hypothetical protein
MAERLIEKLDRLGAEAGINEMTPEIRRFALLVAQEVVAQWPKRPWMELTDEEIWKTISRIGTSDSDVNPYAKLSDARAIEAKLKELNHG